MNSSHDFPHDFPKIEDSSVYDLNETQASYRFSVFNNLAVPAFVLGRDGKLYRVQPSDLVEELAYCCDTISKTY